MVKSGARIKRRRTCITSLPNEFTDPTSCRAVADGWKPLPSYPYPQRLPCWIALRSIFVTNGQIKNATGRFAAEAILINERGFSRWF